MYLESARIVAELSVQWSDGSREVIIPPFPINRRSVLRNTRNLWKISLREVKNQVISSLKDKKTRGSKDLSPASFTLKATFSCGGISKYTELVLLPLDSTSSTDSVARRRYPNLNLQLTTSTKTPRVTNNVFAQVYQPLYRNKGVVWKFIVTSNTCFLGWGKHHFACSQQPFCRRLSLCHYINHKQQDTNNSTSQVNINV